MQVPTVQSVVVNQFQHIPTNLEKLRQAAQPPIQEGTSNAKSTTLGTVIDVRV